MGEACRPLLPLLLMIHHDLRIERDHAVGVGQQRVDIELGDLPDIGDELRQAHHGRAHRVAVGSGARSR